MAKKMTYKERTITRTISFTKVQVVTVDLDNPREDGTYPTVVNVSYLMGAYTNDGDAMNDYCLLNPGKAVALVKVLGVDEQLYGLSESEFVRHGHVIEK